MAPVFGGSEPGADDGARHAGALTDPQQTLMIQSGSACIIGQPASGSLDVAPLQNEFSVDDFVDRYIEAFESRDGRSVATFYNSPCLSVRADGSVHTFADRVEIEGFFTSVLEAYAKAGMARFTAANVVSEPMGTASRRLVCTWSMRRADDSVIREWRQTYIFQLAATDWKIIASIFHL